MATVKISGGRLVGSDDTPVDVVIADGRVEAVGPPSGGQEPTVDAEGLLVAPGFVDIQINGGHGSDLLTDPVSMWQLGQLLPHHGVTSFLPTIITSPREATDAAIDALGDRPPDYVGAEPLGLHFEGPMLSVGRKGAHPESLLVPPSLDVIRGWSRAAGVVLVTIAPELPGAIEVIEELVRRGVTVSLGHSEASAEVAAVAHAAGAAAVTHLFNAMEPLAHRAPSLLAFALAEPGVVAGLILDGVHVDPIVARAAWNAKGPSGIALVTDAVAPMGQPAGAHRIGRREIVSDGAVASLPDGTLAGSVLTMDRAVRNAVDFTGCSVADAVAAATSTPASLIGAADRGMLEPGRVADIVLLEPDLSVAATFCAGRLAHVADSAMRRLPQELVRSLP